VAWSGSRYAAVGDSGAVSYSADGRHWTTADSGTRDQFNAVAWTGSRFVVAALAFPYDPRTYTSADAVTWRLTPGHPEDLRRLLWPGSSLVGVGLTGSIAAGPSGAMQSLHSGTPLDLLGLAQGPSGLAAVGVRGTILFSADGVTWSDRAPGPRAAFSDAVSNGSTLVAVGERGQIASGRGGGTGPLRAPGPFRRPFAGAWSGSPFPAVGEAGTILTSPDGITWTPRSGGEGQNIQGIVWDGRRFVAVGSGGAVL